jgi:hypothetical protein
MALTERFSLTLPIRGGIDDGKDGRFKRNGEPGPGVGRFSVNQAQACILVRLSVRQLAWWGESRPTKQCAGYF